jgi:hypothetical protein
MRAGTAAFRGSTGAMKLIFVVGLVIQRADVECRWFDVLIDGCYCCNPRFGAKFGRSDHSTRDIIASGLGTRP